MENNMWFEKYRPREFNDVVGVPESIVNCVSSGKINHLLLTGHAGTGKTTSAKIIINKLSPKDTLMLNASNDRGIDIIRTKVKDFAMTNSSSGGIKIVFLDEADYLTKDAQASLRNLMEEYSRTCRFILTGNYENKIIDALKSRCNHFKFSLPNKDQIILRLRYISDKEKLNITDEALNEIVNKHFPDIRKCINVLQELSDLNKEITIEHVKIENTQCEELFKQLQNKDIKFGQIRQWILENNLDYQYLITRMVDFVFENKPKSTLKILLILLDINRNINTCANPEIEFSVNMYKIKKELIQE